VTDPVSRAYALLGLSPGATPELLRKQYKTLVRRWHPDRFAGDPQGQSEASLRLRAINDAYHLLLQRSAPAPEAPPSRPPRPRGESLSREEIDRIVQALGTEGPVDQLLAALRVVGRAVGIPFAVLFLSLRLYFGLSRGEWGAHRAEPVLFLLPVVVSVVLAAWYFQGKSQGRRG
jgi:DnaJ domain